MPALVPGSRLGHYDILDSLGAGGMGEVYRATDTRLKRQVALKVLPATVTADPERLARFQREAELLASLNHPNIAGLHGIEESDGVKALVMELVEGPTLADRIAQGPIPVTEALTIARQIADALAAAHDQGIIHRDLKPANIKLRPDGEVKVLDFGLAKAMDRTDDIGSSSLQTITSPAMTMHGVILGTAAYMSPEQAAGRPIDRRSDLWAFGVVLMEMLTGRQTFAGETVSDVIASVLKDEPDWKALPASTPPSIHRLLRKCLERDRKKRWPDAAAARIECEDALTGAGQPVASGAASPRTPGRAVLTGVAGLIIGAVIAGGAAWLVWPPAQSANGSTRFAIELPADQVFTRSGRQVLAVSPDGRHVVFVANSQLNLRALADLSTNAIDGTKASDPSQPTFSPDGQWIAFWANGFLKKVPVRGGTPISLVEAGNPLGISWDGDRIVYASDTPPAISEVSADGGVPKVLVEFDGSKKEQPQSPQLIEDGDALLFTLRANTASWDEAAVVVQDLRTGARSTVVERATDGRLLPGNRLVYSRAATVFSVTYDPGRRSASGAVDAVQERVLQSVGGFSGASMAAFSSQGTLAYVPDDTYGSLRVLLRMTRRGELQKIDLPARPHWSNGFGTAMSPDGTRVAVRIMGSSSAQTDIWIADLSTKAFTRMSFSGTASDPVWTPDGTRVCFEDASASGVVCQPFDGSAPSALLLRHPGLSNLRGFSPDGASALLTVLDAKTGMDLWLAPTTPPYNSRAVVATPGDDVSASISPDGRWLAYASEESGADEIYVRPFPDLQRGRWQISTAGGQVPKFSRDGKELYYVNSRTAGTSTALTLMAAKILPSAAFATSPPEVIAPLPFGVRDYDVAPDGRFLLSAPVASIEPGGGAPRQTLVVVQNWQESLASRASTAPR